MGSAFLESQVAQVKYRTIDTSGDTLVWVGTETTFYPNWDTGYDTCALTVSAWGREVSMSPLALAEGGGT
jgi:hypothetical protein